MRDYVEINFFILQIMRLDAIIDQLCGIAPFHDIRGPFYYTQYTTQNLLSPLDSTAS